MRMLPITPLTDDELHRYFQRVFVPEGLVMLRGAALRNVWASGETTHVVQDADEYVRVLSGRFDLDVPEMGGFWPSVWTRHLEWQSARAGCGSS
jgi:hypothetical protein